MRSSFFFYFVCGACYFVSAQQRSLSLKEAIALYKDSHRGSPFAVEMAQADIITAGLRPNPILNNQSLQLSDPNYYRPGTSWSDGYNRQVWWQLTKPMLLPGVRDRKIGFAEASLQAQVDLSRDNARAGLLRLGEAWIGAWLAHRRRQCFELAKYSSDSIVAAAPMTDNECRLSQKEFNLRVKMVLRHDDKTNSDLQERLGNNVAYEIDTSASSLEEFILMANGLAAASTSVAGETDQKNSFVAVAAANLKLQKALAWPVPELGAIFNPQNTVPYWGVFATLHIPVFSRNQGEIRKARLQFEQAQTLHKFDEQHAPLEAEEKRIAFLNARSNLTDYQEIYFLSKSVYEKELKEIGKDGCQLATSRIALLERELHYLDAQADFFRSLVAFLSIYGTFDETGK